MGYNECPVCKALPDMGCNECPVCLASKLVFSELMLRAEANDAPANIFQVTVVACQLGSQGWSKCYSNLLLWFSRKFHIYAGAFWLLVNSLAAAMVVVKIIQQCLKF